MANRNRDAGRERFWRATLNRQAKSGLSVREFCRREKLGESNFYAWRRTIAERGQQEVPSRQNRQSVGRGGKTKRSKSAPAFVPVAVNGRSQNVAGIVLELGRVAPVLEPVGRQSQEVLRISRRSCEGVLTLH